MKLLKKYSIKVPENIKIVYLPNKNFITFISPLGRKSLRLKLKIILLEPKNLIYITKESEISSITKQKKKLEALQGTIVALLKQSILEISVLLYKKLELVGVGYKVFFIKDVLDSIMHFRLGYSHPIFFKFDSKLKVKSFKSTSLYIFGNSYNQINQIAAVIRSYKYPEPYKGKGILYQNEKVKLKEGKKV